MSPTYRGTKLAQIKLQTKRKKCTGGRSVFTMLCQQERESWELPP